MPPKRTNPQTATPQGTQTTTNNLTPTPTQKKKSVAWDSDGDGVQTSIRILLDWLGADDNYARWRGNGSGLTKVALANEIVLELAKFHTGIPNLLRGRPTEETEDNENVDSPRTPLVSSDALEGAADDEGDVTVGRTGGTKRKSSKMSESLGLEKVLDASNAHRIKCFEARERRDKAKAAAKKHELMIEDRKVMVLENEARARANQMEMAEIRERLRFMRELQDLGLPESQIQDYMKAQFNVGEGSGSNTAAPKETTSIDVGDDDDDEDEEADVEEVE
ncbi:hypothetical protein PSTG_04268 [Puccinia striiformis f. sp. tritici PST-78]|uniref:No apical meristem-associated C-terminal domain-containing protein n=1 Tax=Puccinia striiformis f. sp. tritici PST-78 TaxID=1165861 RepID=A0A0L0VTM9_9BASI|nr:hypothetical protein PSTG_04268 [Puccinia striiformis f. sp. tritici PST-78]